HRGQWQVWQPHFQPFLIDSLAEDIFEHVGRVTTLDELPGATSDSGRFFTERVIAWVLAGERERAVDYVRQMERHAAENPYWKHWAREQWAFLERDIE